jgi:TetR/AcrR family transcriptional repressor of nem operon
MSNKDKLISSAMDLFHQQGFRLTSIDDLLIASGVCRSNFYYHFKSKEALGLVVLQRKIEEIHSLVVEPTLGRVNMPIQQQIEALFYRMIDYCKSYDFDRGCFFGQVILESESEQPLFQLSMKFFKDLEIQLSALIKLGLEEQQYVLNGIEPEEFAAAVISLLQGGILLAKGYKQPSVLLSSIKLLTAVMADSKAAM